MTVSILDTNVEFPIATVTLEDEWGVMWSLDFWHDGAWWVVDSWVIDEEGQPRRLEAPAGLIMAGYREMAEWGDAHGGERGSEASDGDHQRTGTDEVSGG